MSQRLGETLFSWWLRECGASEPVPLAGRTGLRSFEGNV